MTHTRKFPVDDRSTDWGRWTTAHFQSGAGRDGFLQAVAATPDGGWDAEAAPNDLLGAQVRWRAGRFLRLNDVAYSHGGRITVNVDPHAV